MVQLWTDKSSVFSFYVNVECPLENVTVFVAVVGVPRGGESDMNHGLHYFGAVTQTS